MAEDAVLILPSPPATVDLEELADFDPATHCDVSEKKGARMLRKFVMDRISTVRDGGIVRACSAGDPDKVDEHKEGRAWDCSCDLETGQAIVDWLVAPDEQGRPFANARRLGVMYFIHNRVMWRAYAWAGLPGGTAIPYSGPSPHTDHVHISLTRAGGAGTTSFYAWLEAAAPGGPASEPPAVPASDVGKICAVVFAVGLAGVLAWQAVS